MVNPTGYTALDLVGFTDRGTYASSANYVKNDLVHYGGNIWRVLVDDTQGVAPSEGTSYTLFMHAGEGGGGGIMYGTCSTAAATAAKAVTVSADQGFALTVGVTISVYFSNTNTASNPTINVNTTGAKSIYYNTAALTTSNLGMAGTANRYENYMYDGTYWVWIGHGVDSNTTYTNMSQTEATTGTATTGRNISAKVLHDTIAASAPVGTVITMAHAQTGDVSGITTPTGIYPSGSNYLVCDGSVYSISTYSALAAYFATAYGSNSYFGGNGTSTFAVPDWSQDFPTNGVICIKAK